MSTQTVHQDKDSPTTHDKAQLVLAWAMPLDSSEQGTANAAEHTECYVKQHATMPLYTDMLQHTPLHDASRQEHTMSILK